MDRSLANLGLSRRASIWVPAALGLLGVAVTLFVWHAQVEQARGSLEDRFAAAAQDRADAVEQQLNASLAIVQMLGGVLDADNVIDETVFSGVSQRRARHRHAQARVSRPCHRGQRTTSPAGAW